MIDECRFQSICHSSYNSNSGMNGQQFLHYQQYGNNNELGGKMIIKVILAGTLLVQWLIQ